MIKDIERIKKELQTVGIYVNDIYDLVNTKEPYPEAIPILINLLKEGLTHDGVKEGVIRALAVKEARGMAGSVLLEEYYKLPKDKMLLRWIIGNTIEVVITENELESVLKIVSNKENGMSRQMFVVALGKVKSEKAELTLIDLLSDDEVTAHALKALGTLRSKKAKNKITELLNHPMPIIRKEAQKALKKIG